MLALALALLALSVKEDRAPLRSGCAADSGVHSTRIAES
jgi:hypothetical protein